MSAVELDRVTLARGERVVLRELTATIADGEFVGVFGPNGAGKSTLLHAILGLLTPVSGTIRVHGAAPSRGNAMPATCRSIARTSPSFACAGATSWSRRTKAIASASRSRAMTRDRAADRALDAVGASALAKRPLAQLSGGERQRLLLAQALVGEPRLLLLDEPLLSLDPGAEKDVVALIKRLQQSLGMTVLFTAHELNPLLGSMDRVLYLGHGRGAIGSVDEVMRSDVLSELYGADIDVVRVGGRIVIVSGDGMHDADAHHHDA